VSCQCDFGAGLSTCHCAGCHETFTSVSAFDMHQRIGDGGLTCLAPWAVTKRDGSPAMTVVRTVNGRADDFPVWGQYDPRPRQFNSGAEISATLEGAPVSSPTPESEAA
jgi:hypothetical protein